jgi:hypothetical protein
MNFARHEFSLLLVDPKPKMLEWLNAFQKRKGLERYRLYYPEGNLVVAVPKVDHFSVPGSLAQFLDRMKPELLEYQLSNFTVNPEHFGYPITKETFDEFLDLSIRDSAVLMSDFKEAESLCMMTD